MDIPKFTHDSIPQVLQYIVQRLDDIDRKMGNLSSDKNQSQEDKWLNVDDLIEYLPHHPAKQTIYGWTSHNLIPYYKNGKSVVFRKSEIDAWLLSQAVQSRAEIAQEAEKFIASKKGGRRA